MLQTTSAKVDRAGRESQQSGSQTQSAIISVHPAYRDTLNRLSIDASARKWRMR
jgi:hypothetical protein